MNTEYEFDELLRVVEDATEVDPVERDRARTAMLRCYRAERSTPTGPGAAEVVRLGSHTEAMPSADRRRRYGWLGAAAVLVALAIGLTQLTRRPEPPSDPVASRPTLQLPSTSGSTLPEAGELVTPGTYDASAVGVPAVFEIDRDLVLADATDGAVVFELPGDPAAGQLLVAFDARIVGATDLEGWLEVTDADVQRGFLTVLGERTDVVDILGSPTSERCAANRCALVESARGAITLDAATGSLTQVIVTDVSERPLFIVARDSTPMLDLHAAAFTVARSLVLAEDGA